jgi:hypothetical protein
MHDSKVGLMLWGISVEKGYHWIVGQIAFFLCEQCKISRVQGRADVD